MSKGKKRQIPEKKKPCPPNKGKPLTYWERLKLSWQKEHKKRRKK